MARGIYDTPGQISDTLSLTSMSSAPGSALSANRHALGGESRYSYCDSPGARRERRAMADSAPSSQSLLCQTEDRHTRIEVRLENETV